VNERFIALHMMMARMRPLDPSRAPAVIRSLLSNAKPIATAESPAYEFRIAMTVGMSAPPIGMISSTPKSNASPMITGNSRGAHGAVGWRVIAAASASARPNSDRFVTFCPGYVTGRCGTHVTSCSLPAAIKLPVSVRYPRRISAISATIRKVVRCSGPSDTPR